MIAAFFRHGFRGAGLLTVIVMLIVGGAVLVGIQLTRK